MGDNGNYHFQGYIEFSKAKRLNAVRALIPGAHWETRRGSADQADHYCRKPIPGCDCNLCRDSPPQLGGPYVFGVMKGQGRRSDLAGLRASILDGATVEELFDDHFALMLVHSRAAQEFKRIKTDARKWPMEVICYIGGTGTGKSRKAFTDYPDAFSVQQAKGRMTYWDDYDGQETVIVDEMYGNRFSWGFLLQLTDRHAFKVPVHHGTREFVSRRIIFTSNQHPSMWYHKMENAYPWDHTNPFKRRITQLRIFTMEGQVDELVRDLHLAEIGNPTILAQTSDEAVAAEYARQADDQEAPLPANDNNADAVEVVAGLDDDDDDEPARRYMTEMEFRALRGFQQENGTVDGQLAGDENAVPPGSPVIDYINPDLSPGYFDPYGDEAYN